MSQHQYQEVGGGGVGTIIQLLSSRSARRKGTDHSVELALIECARESESDGSNKERQYQGMVMRIREELMEATDPLGYAQRKLRAVQEQEQSRDEYYKQFQSFGESPTLRLSFLNEEIKEEDRSPNLSSNYMHLGSLDFESKGFLAVIVEDNVADAETEIMKEDEMSPSKLLRRNPQLSIKIEDIAANEMVESSRSSSIQQHQVPGIRQSVGSCDKSTVQKAFFGIDPTIQISGHANSINENLTIDLKDDCQEKLVTKVCHRKSSEDHTQIPLPIFNFNQKNSTSLVPQLRTSQQNLVIPISQRNKSQQQSAVSPLAAGNRSHYDNNNFSPRSSNLSSFYMDHIEDMLPEKMLVTHKKLMRNYIQMNPMFGVRTSSATLPATLGSYGGGLGGTSPSASPHTPIIFGYGPYQRSQGTTISSLNRRMLFRWRKDDRQKYQDPPFHVKISQLKDSLTKFKDTKAQRKEIAKKNIAQSMKFLRKLGSKLRKQYTNRRFATGKSEDRQVPPAQFSQASANAFNSPSKSNTDESHQRISPRQSIMQSQQLKNELQPTVTQGFQIKVHDVTPQEDSHSAPKILKLGQLQKDAPPPQFLMPNQSAFSPMFNFFQGRFDFPHTAKNASDDQLPLFHPKFPLFSFERQGSFNVKDRADSNDLVVKHDTAAGLKREMSSDLGLNTRSNNQSCDFGGNNRQGSFADVRSNNSQIEETKRTITNNIRQNSSSGILYDDPSRQFSFAPKDVMSAFQQLQQMQSPIPGMRNDVREALDDVEENLMEAIQEYRQDNFIKDFHHYKDYYIDAQQQNAELLRLQVPPSKVDLALHSSSGSNRSGLDFGDIQPRPRDHYVSFKDQRNFENSSNEIWKQHMDNLLLDEISSGKEVEKTNPTPRVPTIFEKIIEEDEQEWNEIERQVSKQDEIALINQSQPIVIEQLTRDRAGSKLKSDKKKQISNSNYRKICDNIRDLATSLEESPHRQANFIGNNASTQDLIDGPDSSRVSRRDNHHQQQHASKVSSLERGQIRLTTSGSRSRSGGSLNKLSSESPKNTLKAKERLQRSQMQQASLMKDTQALKKIHLNLKRLYEDLSQTCLTAQDSSPGIESLMHRLTFSNNSNKRQLSNATTNKYSLGTAEAPLSPPSGIFQESPIHPQSQLETLQPQQMLHKAKGHRTQQPKQRQVPQINLNLLQCVRINSTQGKVNINLSH